MADLSAEHSMRSIEPPWEAVQKEMRQFSEELSQMSADEVQTRFPGYGRAVDEFMAERDKPPH